MSDCKCHTCGTPIVCQMGRPCPKCPGDPRQQSKKEYSFFKPGMFVRLKAGGDILRVVKVTEKASDALQEEDENKRCLLTCTGSTSNVIQCREDVVDEVSIRPWTLAEAIGRLITYPAAQSPTGQTQFCQITQAHLNKNQYELLSFYVVNAFCRGIERTMRSPKSLLESGARQLDGTPCGVILEDEE